MGFWTICTMNSPCWLVTITLWRSGVTLVSSTIVRLGAATWLPEGSVKSVFIGAVGVRWGGAGALGQNDWQWCFPRGQWLSWFFSASVVLSSTEWLIDGLRHWLSKLTSIEPAYLAISDTHIDCLQVIRSIYIGNGFNLGAANKNAWHAKTCGIHGLHWHLGRESGLHEWVGGAFY